MGLTRGGIILIRGDGLGINIDGCYGNLYEYKTTSRPSDTPRTRFN
jgi:hypothetical protein